MTRAEYCDIIALRSYVQQTIRFAQMHRVTKHDLGRAKLGHGQEKDKLLKEVRALELQRDMCIIEVMASGIENPQRAKIEARIEKIMTRLHKICMPK